MDVKFKRLDSKAIFPVKGTPGANALDLYACLDEPVVIQPGQTAKIPTGLAVETPVGYASLLFPRSGLALNYRISLANSVGLVDTDYRGEIGIPLINHSESPFTVTHGDRVAQIAIVPFLDFNPVEAYELSATERADGGFGHTGIR